jgi:hypothetical protein
MSKLTLTVDASVVDRAKRFATASGTSVSALVEAYLEALTRTPGNRDATLASAPITARLSGLLAGRKADEADHRRHLEKKYR